MCLSIAPSRRLQVGCPSQQDEGAAGRCAHPLDSSAAPGFCVDHPDRESSLLKDTMTEAIQYEAFLKHETGTPTTSINQLFVTRDSRTLITAREKTTGGWDVETRKLLRMLLGQIGAGPTEVSNGSRSAATINTWWRSHGVTSMEHTMTVIARLMYACWNWPPAALSSHNPPLVLPYSFEVDLL